MKDKSLNPENQHTELGALISMMDEPSEEMFTSIRDKIKSYGLTAIPFLEDAWLKTEDDDDALRIELLIDDIRFTDLFNELSNWSHFYSDDLLKAFIILNRFRYPDLDEDKYLEKISKLKQTIWLEINQELTALEKVKVLNHIFFDVYRFRGQLPQQVSINAHFLSDLMDTKKGSAVALGTLYLHIAQSLDIPIFGVDLHHHFALVYMEDNIPTKTPEEYSIDDVLFYIAVVNKGSVFTRNEIHKYLKQMKLEENPSYFLPCSNVHTVRRLIKEMAKTYELAGKQDKSDLLNKLTEAFD
jgi:hypothetical protein